jgi:hypothetical protein
VARDARKPLLAGDARKTHETLWTLRTRMSVQAVMTRMTTHSAGTDRARRTTDSNLLFDMLVKLIYASDIAVETVYLTAE